MNLKNSIAMIMMGLTLAACGSRGGFLGVRSTPNEFKTIQNESLDVPPINNASSLPKPGEGNSTRTTNPQNDVKNALKGATN